MNTPIHIPYLPDPWIDYLMTPEPVPGKPHISISSCEIDTENYARTQFSFTLDGNGFLGFRKIDEFVFGAN